MAEHWVFLPHMDGSQNSHGWPDHPTLEFWKRPRLRGGLIEGQVDSVPSIVFLDPGRSWPRRLSHWSVEWVYWEFVGCNVNPSSKNMVFSLDSLEAPCGWKVRPRPVLHSLQPKLQKSHMHKSIPSVARVGKGVAAVWLIEMTLGLWMDLRLFSIWMVCCRRKQHRKARPSGWYIRKATLITLQCKTTST